MGSNIIMSDRLFCENISNEGCLMKIIKYNGANDIFVEFQDEHKSIVHCAWREFKEGSVKNPFYTSILGIGYVGKTTTKENKIFKKSYIVWTNMMKRCYDKKIKIKQPTYENCISSKEWLCYANFEKWYNKNYYEIDGEQICLDKDILIRGNKIYGEEFCVFVPQSINKLFLKRESKRGNLPIGVHYHKRDRVFESYCSIDKRTSKFLGYYNNKYDAFYAYKKFKENRIKQIADNYKEYIPQKLYDAMYKYEVNITD